MKANTSLLFAAVILFILTNPANAYREVIDLGTLGGSTSAAYSINDNGQIVGVSGGHACLFDATGGGSNIDLGTLVGFNSEAWSINDNGQIVGRVYNSGNHFAYLFDPTGGGANKNLGIGDAYSINNKGQIVGENIFGHEACLFDPTGGQANKNLGNSPSRAYSINDNGQIVGYGIKGIGFVHAYLFDSTDKNNNLDLGTIGGVQSYAMSISDIGSIVGSANNHACLFDATGGGANTDLGTLGGIKSWAYTINNIGQIVGYAYNNSDYQQACLFDPTGQGNNIDLNTFIDPLSGWTLERAFCINNNGWIVGTGINPYGYNRAFLLTPEPTSAILMTIGAALLASRRKRH